MSISQETSRRVSLLNKKNIENVGINNGNVKNLNIFARLERFCSDYCPYKSKNSTLI